MKLSEKEIEAILEGGFDKFKEVLQEVVQEKNPEYFERHPFTKTLDQAAANVLLGFRLDYNLTYYGEFDPLQQVLIDTAGGTYIEVTIFDLCNALDNDTPIEDVYRWIVQCESKYISLHNFLEE